MLSYSLGSEKAFEFMNEVVCVFPIVTLSWCSLLAIHLTYLSSQLSNVLKWQGKSRPDRSLENTGENAQ